jgi:hypothetical protein
MEDMTILFRHTTPGNKKRLLNVKRDSENKGGISYGHGHVGRKINDDRRDRAVYSVSKRKMAPIGTAGGASDKSVGQRGYGWLAVACRTEKIAR